MNDSHDLGRTAELAAADYLERRGWTVLARNWRFHHKEIDLIASRAGTVAFVEVKARRSRSFGHPMDAITRAKRRDLETAARAWLAQHPGPETDHRFDAIWVIGSGTVVHHIEHVPNAWRL